MGISTYSFGEESPLKFEISDKLAKFYNEAAAEWFKAQVRFNQKFGRKWDPVREPIELRWSRKQSKAWNDFAKIFKKVLEEQGPFHENDIMDDFLVRNVTTVASVVLTSTSKGERLITIAVTTGALYGFLKGCWSAVKLSQQEK